MPSQIFNTTQLDGRSNLQRNGIWRTRPFRKDGIMTVVASDEVAFDLLNEVCFRRLTRRADGTVEWAHAAGPHVGFGSILVDAIRELMRAPDVVKFDYRSPRTVEPPNRWYIQPESYEKFRNGQPTGATVFVDPFDKAPLLLYIEGPQGSLYILPQETVPALAHEISHALDDIRGKTRFKNGGTSYSTREVQMPGGAHFIESVPVFEHDAVDFENMVRKELGLGRRLAYVDFKKNGNGPEMLRLCRGGTPCRITIRNVSH